MDKQNRYHHKSIRLKGYDYTLEGAYFITISTADHKCIFGKIESNNIKLSSLGIIASNCWKSIPEHFSNVEVEPFVVMPNHIHGIITITRGTIYRAPTDLADRPPMGSNIFITKEKFSHPVAGSIPTIIRTYKAAVSRFAKNEDDTTNIWQRNYYEHVIRKQDDLERISSYIIANPDNWVQDPEFQQ